MASSFTTTVVSDGVWYIADERGGVMYLVAGKKRALLIDTGFGVGDLKTHVETLTTLPLWVVNTHCHGDHTGSNGLFDEVYVHTADIPFVSESTAKLIPISDDHIFDLGDRDIRVIGVQGHSPGSICLLDEKARILFSGDSPRPGPWWLHLGTSMTVQEAKLGLTNLATVRDKFDTLAPSHGEPMPVGALIQDLIACADGILSGSLAGKAYTSRFNEALLVEVGSAGIIYLEDKICVG